MRMLLVVAIGLIGGILAGLLLYYELVGIVGFLLFNRAVDSRFLPVVLSMIGAAAPVLDERTSRTRK